MNLAENNFSNEYFNFHLGASMVILIIHPYLCSNLADIAVQRTSPVPLNTKPFLSYSISASDGISTPMQT